MLRPNTGINTKLLSLKYTPNTVIASSENFFNIRFIPTVRNEVIEVIIIDGIPISYIFIISCN